MSAEQAKVTILVDNTANLDLVREHGLSLWIQAKHRTILFDTGQGAALRFNSDALGVCLKTADTLVMSHGHYDHTGGVATVLQTNPELDVYCHPAAVKPRYSINGGPARPINMPRSAMAAIDKVSSARMHWVTQPQAISKGIYLTGPIPRSNGKNGNNGTFYLDPMGIRPDPIEDDIALWFETDKGLVVCVGCCHSGLVNTLRHICRVSGIDTIAAVIGGFHMIQFNHRFIDWTISELQELSPELIAPCHCTGEKAIIALYKAFPNRIIPGSAGICYSF